MRILSLPRRRPGATSAGCAGNWSAANSSAQRRSIIGSVAIASYANGSITARPSATPAFHLGHERVQIAPVAGHRLRVDALADRVRIGGVQRLHAFERARGLVVALELQQRVAAVADDARDVRRDGQHGVEVGDRVLVAAQLVGRVAALDARVEARAVDVEAAREREHRVLGAAQREQRAAAAFVRAGVLRVDAQRGVEVGQRRRRLLQRETRGAAADDRLHVLGRQHDGAVVAGERVVLAAEILQHAGAVVVGLRDVGPRGDHRVVRRQRVVQAAGRVQRVAAVVGRLDVVGPQRERAVERRDGLVVPAQRAERVAAVVQRLEHVGPDRERALQALQRLGVAAQHVQRVAEVAVRAGVLRIDGQRLRDQVGGGLRMAGLERQHAQPVQRVEVARRTPQHLAVDRLGLRDAAAVMQRLRLRHQAVQRGHRAERGRTQEDGRRRDGFLGHGSGDSVHRARRGAQPALWPQAPGASSARLQRRREVADRRQHALDAVLRLGVLQRAGLVEGLAGACPARTAAARRSSRTRRCRYWRSRFIERSPPSGPGDADSSAAGLLAVASLPPPPGARPGCATASRTR
jgi:hypothetical protein